MCCLTPVACGTFLLSLNIRIFVKVYHIIQAR